MDFAKQPLFAMISQRIGWLSERQKVLAENVANVDTPSYKPRDIKTQTFEQMVQGASSMMGMARTNSHHIDAGTRNSGGAKSIKDKPVETTISGNAVTLDNELMKLSETAQDHQLATTLYRKNIGMFRTVLGRGGIS